MSGRPTPSVPTGSRFALTVLVALVILSPWPFGSAHLRTTQAIALISLATALGAFIWDGWHRQLQLPPRVILWPLLGLWALAVFQLIPFPEALHRAIAPGSAAVWHPNVPAAAAVLGPGPHPISLYPEATRRWLAFAAGVVALALAAAPALRERRLLLRSSAAIVAGALLVALYGFVARLAFGNRLYGVWSVPTVSPFGPFVSKNHFAGYVEMATLLAAGLAIGLTDDARRGEGWLSWVDSRRAKWIVVAWGAVFVLALAVPLSLSRGGVVSLGAGLVFLAVLRFWTRHHAKRPVLGLVATLVVVVAAGGTLVATLPAEPRDRVLTLAGITSDRSGAFRLALWHDTLRLVASSAWVGSGFGAYGDALARFKTVAGNFRVGRAENDYLEHLADSGVMGGALLASFVGPFLLGGLRAVRAGAHPFQRGLSAGGLAGLASVGVHSTFDFNLRIPSNTLLFVALAVFAFRPRYAMPATPATESLGTPRLRTFLPAGVLACTAIVALSVPWVEARIEPAMIGRAAAGAPAGVRRAAIQANVYGHLRGRPADPYAWVVLAWLRAPSSRGEAASLANWAVRLDPLNDALRRAVFTLGSG